MASDDVDLLAGQVALDIVGVQITDLSKSELQAVRKIISDSLYNGWTPHRTASRISQIVGLSKRQMNSVANHRAALIKQGKTDSQADRAAESLAKRLRKQRGRLVAQHEARRAQTAAQRLLWKSQQDAGTLSPYAVRVWRTAKDELRCPSCRALNGRRMSLRTDEQLPPMHPNCRCTMELVDEGVVKAAFKYDEHDVVAKARVRDGDGDGDGFIYDDTPRHNGVVVLTYDDIISKIRRVRTPAGERRYGLPIGAPIVARGRADINVPGDSVSLDPDSPTVIEPTREERRAVAARRLAHDAERARQRPKPKPKPEPVDPFVRNEEQARLFTILSNQRNDYREDSFGTVRFTTSLYVSGREREAEFQIDPLPDPKDGQTVTIWLTDSDGTDFGTIRWRTRSVQHGTPAYFASYTGPTLRNPDLYDVYDEEMAEAAATIARTIGLEHHRMPGDPPSESKPESPKKPKVMAKRGKLEVLDDGSGRPKLPKSVEETIRDAFTYHDPDTGLSTNVQSIYTEYGGNRINVTGSIVRIDEDGDEEEVGSFTRTLRLTDGIVDHNFFNLKTGYKGQGFMQRWFGQLFDFYENEEFEQVEVHANIDVGGYAWARKGFDWSGAPPYKVTETLRFIANDTSGVDEYPEWLVTQARDMVKRIDKGQHVSAQEVADLGMPEWKRGEHWTPKVRGTFKNWRDDEREQVLAGMTLFSEDDHQYDVYSSGTYAKNMPIGKAILLGTDWYGQLSLSKVKKSAKPSGRELFDLHTKWVNALYDKRAGGKYVARKHKKDSDYHLHHFDVDQDDANERLLDLVLEKAAANEDAKEKRAATIRKGRDLLFGTEYKVEKGEPDGESLYVPQPLGSEPDSKPPKGKKKRKKKGKR